SYSSKLHNLILKHNQYDMSIFLSNQLFSGVKNIDGLLDLRLLTFYMDDEQKSNKFISMTSPTIDMNQIDNSNYTFIEDRLEKLLQLAKNIN
ncbi:unnamed protein product, partial [Didymodactylos carnosus]